MGDRGGAKRTAAAALIFHYDGAEQRLDPVRRIRRPAETE